MYAALRKALPPTLQVLQQSTAEDSDVLVVTQQTSASLGLASMAALAPHCPQPTLGAAGEWPARWKDKIASVYGCTLRQILSTDAGGPVTLETLRSGRPNIVANHWVQLADPQHPYPAPRVVALARRGGEPGRYRCAQSGIRGLDHGEADRA